MGELAALLLRFLALVLFGVSSRALDPKSKPEVSASGPTLAQLIEQLHDRAKRLESSSGMRSSFESFTSAYEIAPDTRPCRTLRMICEHTIEAADRCVDSWSSVEEGSSGSSQCAINPSAFTVSSSSTVLPSFLMATPKLSE